jgi:hypothetical protein
MEEVECDRFALAEMERRSFGLTVELLRQVHNCTVKLLNKAMPRMLRSGRWPAYKRVLTIHQWLDELKANARRLGDPLAAQTLEEGHV